MADTASFSGFLKDKALPILRDGLHSGKVLLFGGDSGNPEGFQGIQRSAEHINHVGSEFRIPLKVKRNQAVGFRHEGERLPAAGTGEYTWMTEPLRHGYGVFNISGQLLKASATDEGAFKSAFKQEMEDTVTTSKIDWNRAAFGDGSGTMAGIRNNEAVGQTVIDVTSTINFRGGEIIDFVVAATGVITDASWAAQEVLAVDRVNRTITVSKALAGTGLTAGTHVIVRSSSSSTNSVPNNSYQRETQGLASIVSDTGTLHTVNPVTYPLWKSYVAAVGGSLADINLHNALDGVGFETGVDPESQDGFVMVTTRGVRSRYAQTLTTLKQFTNAEAMHLRGGFKVLDFDGRPIYTDDQCQLGTLYGLSTKDLFWAESSDWEWMEEDGAVLNRVSGYDRYEAILFKYANLGTVMRNRHFKLTGITDDTK